MIMPIPWYVPAGEMTKRLYLQDVDHLVVREWVNGLWAAMSLCVVVVFGAYLIRSLTKSIHEGGVKSWRDDSGNRAAIALFFYFLGETLMRGWVWSLLMTQNAGLADISHALKSDYTIALIAATISTWAALCCIAVFSQSRVAWIGSAIFIAAFLAFETWLIVAF